MLVMLDKRWQLESVVMRRLLIVTTMACALFSGGFMVPTILTPDSGMQQRGVIIISGCVPMCILCSALLGARRPVASSITFIFHVAALTTVAFLPLVVFFNFEAIGLYRAIWLILLSAVSGLSAWFIRKYLPKLELSDRPVDRF